MQPTLLSGTDLQSQTLRLYGELIARRESWEGRLVFVAGDGASATGLPAAVSVAGGTTLALDADAATVKAVFRRGGIDFVVNTLDEALRVLKNEIRRRRPLGVGLIADVQSTLTEITERGVLPDLEVSLVDARADQRVESVRLARTVEHLRITCMQGVAQPSERLTTWLDERGWSETVFQASTASAQRDLDARLLMSLPAGDALRRQWLHRIERYQRSSVDAARIVWLNDAERAAAQSEAARSEV